MRLFSMRYGYAASVAYAAEAQRLSMPYAESSLAESESPVSSLFAHDRQSNLATFGGTRTYPKIENILGSATTRWINKPGTIT